MKRNSFHRLFVFLFFSLVTPVIFPADALTKDGYVFEKMWPVLEQSWYFDRPGGLAIDGTGNVYVADKNNHRIQKFTPDGVFIAKFSAFGSAPGSLNYPFGITVGATGKVYVSDTQNNRIQIFTETSPTTLGKAIIVAGSGPYATNTLWDATQMCANYAYRALSAQGTGTDCMPIAADLSLPMPCVSYNGSRYGFTLRLYENPYDPSGLYWNMDMSTLEIK